MKISILFDPSIRSLNLGDHIIMRSAEKVLEPITKDTFVIHCATHQPSVTFYQNNSLNPRMKMYDSQEYKFICGSNLLWKNLFLPRPTFNINPFNSRIYKNSILVGVGTKDGKSNFYTRHLYKKILSKKYIHSVRDEETKKFVESLGLKAINTGCPTMWYFTKEFCSKIPTKKQDKVIFTLTDYKKDKEKDQMLIDILLKNYKEVYCWLQGIYDEEYLDSLENTKTIKKINPTLEAYEEILKQEIDYVGTRLHAGMFAMQHKKRTIIIEIDNRVRDMRETYHLNTIKREDISSLEDYINQEIITDISINEKSIKKWMNQFK